MAVGAFDRGLVDKQEDGVPQKSPFGRFGVSRRNLLALLFLVLGLYCLLDVTGLVKPFWQWQIKERGNLRACKNNILKIANALEAYSSANKGRYPERLDELVQKGYLATLPECPEAGAFTYRDYQLLNPPINYSLSCCGDYHHEDYARFGRVSMNYPRYSGDKGLVDHP